jgi:hypothetical protein
VIDQNTALEERRKQMEQVKLRLAEYEKQNDGKRPIVQETMSGHADVVVKKMQRQMAQIQNVLAELQGQSQKENYDVRNSGESSGGPRGGSSESSSQDDDNDEKERSLGTTRTKTRKEAYVNRLKGGMSRSRRIRDQFKGYKASHIHQWFKSGLAPVAVADRVDAKLLLHLHVGADCAPTMNLQKLSGSVYWDMFSQLWQQRCFKK